MTDMTPEPDDSGEQPLAEATPSGAIETGDGAHTEPAEEAAPVEEPAPADAAEPSGGVAAPGALFEAPEGAAAEPPLRAGLEAILLVVDEPVPEVTLAQILERPREEVVATLRELAAEYTEQARGFDLREIAGGWRFYTRDVCAPLVERFVRDGQAARLTQAALETLAVIAYRQPVNRARISAIRGVNSDGVIRTLTMRGLIEEAGHDPEHQAVLYRTTTYFLERLGLNTVDELPELAPYLPDDLEGIEELQQ
jgi:segregation and condensation protein B